MTIQVTEEQLNDIVKKAIEKSVKSAVAEVLQKKESAVDVEPTFRKYKRSQP